MEREMDSTTTNVAQVRAHEANRYVRAQAVPQLCRGNCGFYGSPSLDHYCSKCAKEHVKNTQDSLALLPTATTSSADDDDEKAREQEARVEGESSLSRQRVRAEIVAIVEPVAVSTSSKMVDDPSAIDETASPKPKLKANRCHSCKRKVGLTGFDCRCGGKFCSDHRYSDAHNCEFDYKQLGQQEVRKNNPAVVSAKIEKI